MCDPDRISKSGVFSTRYNRTGINVGNMTRVSVPFGRRVYGLRKPSRRNSTGRSHSSGNSHCLCRPLYLLIWQQAREKGGDGGVDGSRVWLWRWFLFCRFIDGLMHIIWAPRGVTAQAQVAGIHGKRILSPRLGSILSRWIVLSTPPLILWDGLTHSTHRVVPEFHISNLSPFLINPPLRCTLTVKTIQRPTSL